MVAICGPLIVVILAFVLRIAIFSGQTYTIIIVNVQEGATKEAKVKAD